MSFPNFCHDLEVVLNSGKKSFFEGSKEFMTSTIENANFFMALITRDQKMLWVCTFGYQNN